MVTEKIEKAPNSIHITIQHPTNNSFRNINKHPEWLSRTKFKSPFKKIIQTRHFLRFQSIEFHLAHERYVVWTASLRRKFANRKYRVILCLFVTHSSRHSKFSYVWKNGKILCWKILREHREFLLWPCHVREFKTVLGSAYRAVDSGFRYWIPAFVSGTSILDSHR